MIHPDTELRFVNEEIGYGVFATRDIPRGTILYVKDQLEIEITPQDFKKLEPEYQNIVDKFSYIDERGIHIISWDHAKYVNHKCDCNSMSTAYGFEIAIRDIARDEEITDEYGMFNIPVSIAINCGCTNCRKTLMPSDLDQHYALWDQQVQTALGLIETVHQPLWAFMDGETRNKTQAYLAGIDDYQSVLSLKYSHRTGQVAKKNVKRNGIRVA